MCEVHCCLNELTKQLEGIAYTEEEAFGAVAEKIATGPVADLQKLVKATGYAVSESFGSQRPSVADAPYGQVPYACGSDPVVCCIMLLGEVAETVAVGKVIVPMILEAPTEYPSVDSDALAKLWPAFEKTAMDRVNALCAAVEKMDMALAKNRR